jgi:hypothetical protein
VLVVGVEEAVAGSIGVAEAAVEEAAEVVAAGPIGIVEGAVEVVVVGSTGVVAVVAVVAVVVVEQEPEEVVVVVAVAVPIVEHSAVLAGAFVGPVGSAGLEEEGRYW